MSIHLMFILFFLLFAQKNSGLEAPNPLCFVDFAYVPKIFPFYGSLRSLYIRCFSVHFMIFFL